MTTIRRYLIFAIFGVILFSMIDTLVAAVSTPFHLFKVVAGEEKTVSGRLAGVIVPIDNPEPQPFLSNRIEDPVLLERALAYAPAYETFSLRFVELRGRLWRARIRTDAGARPGDYPIHVYQQAKPPEADDPQFTVRLFENETALRRSHLSVFRRWFGFDPWWATIALVPAALWAFFRTWKAAGRQDADLQQKGLGPIYRLAKKKDGWELIFGLGKDHGVQTNDILQICDARGGATGQQLTAEKVGKESAHGRLDLAADIKPDYLIGK